VVGAEVGNTLVNALFYTHNDSEWYAFAAVSKELERRGWHTVAMTMYDKDKVILAREPKKRLIGGKEYAVCRPLTIGGKMSRISPRIGTMADMVVEFGPGGPTATELFDLVKPDILILRTERGFIWRELAELARRKGVPVAIVACAMCHLPAYTEGPLGGVAPFLGDVHCIISQGAYDILKHRGYKYLDKVVVTGTAVPEAPWLDVTGNQWQPDKEAGPILFTEQHDFPPDQKARINMLKALHSLALAFPDRQVLVRPHFERAWNDELDLNLMLEYPVGMLKLPAVAPNLAMANRGVCIFDACRAAWRMVTVASLSSVDAAVCGTPVVSMGWLHDFPSPEYKPTDVGEPAGSTSYWHRPLQWFFDESVPVAMSVDELIYDVEEASLGPRFLEYYCGVDGEPSSVRIADVLEDLVDA